MKRCILFSISLILAISAFAQTKTITGRVVDPSTKESLFGASVVEKEPPMVLPQMQMGLSAYKLLQEPKP